MTKQSGPYVDPPEWAVRPHKRVCDDIGQVDRDCIGETAEGA